jgi:polysaccharide export outer membrane protein
MFVKLRLPANGRRIIYLSRLCVIISAFLFGCKSIHSATYFKDIPDSIYNRKMSILLDDGQQVIIRPGDILQVSIQSVDPELNNMLGTSNRSLVYSLSDLPHLDNQVSGFLVDRYGLIELPMVGSIKVAGLSTLQIRDSIRTLALPYYKKPVVNVRLANFRVTVLGEVAHPGSYSVSNENVNILEAIGMAGDLTIYAKRENVLLIRKENGEKQFMRLNLNSSSLFKSPWFSLRQGDVVYVEPNKTKISSSDLSKTRTYTLLAAGASVLIVLLSRVSF